ncbi:2',3'-cyclic-nucleotide 2'-phosphodiesterase/5'-or 3'-nucleotidase, 5'-nucleotidase family [Paenibacillus sp. UNCCL117]|uniref:choice-of-anchor I family protein n=1 Tax=unclassified Paenibacillus TaxID=185978 RepID=UPI00088C6F81|nr:MULTISPECIES: choice-of-anchor I family protein [unclassified Paenibacillus]SDE12257.1 2',3'-cyclic-nucleotide 2'-phosphodiesterase/5'-or 3'-nucleotidase, 5'-nucleotidase family [Paenibacillus sp. cl123]SFW60142.1 2',3'-cyclic-nucleotide 2'-phosphodiesterase/5'-or 3'-nucleotidase, 5'-nucleotidase family [Paenibacillus sp. UNCCL117]
MNKKGKTILSLLLAGELIAGSLLAGQAPARASEPLPPPVAGTPYTAEGGYDVTVPHVFIQQVYGGGLSAAADAPVSHGFIELYNPTDQDIPLNQWSLHYAYNDKKLAANPEGTTSPWQQLNLTGTIKARSSYLITGKPTGAAGAGLKVDLSSKSDQSIDTFIYNKAMKVALMSNQAPLTVPQPFSPNLKPAGYVDLVGAADNDAESAIDGYEIAYPTGSAEGKSKKKGIVRKALTDTDNNQADFRQIDYSSADAAELLRSGPRGGVDGAWPSAAVGVSTDKLAEAYVGSPYSVTLSAYGGKPPYSFHAEGLPPGLSLDSAGGHIQGQPMAGTEGTAAVTVTVYDSAEPRARGTRLLPLTVQPAKPALTPDSLKLEKIAHYQVGASNKDGGVAEIVKYNSDNRKLYIVSGSANPPSLDIVPLTAGGTLAKEKSVMVKELAEQNGFLFGDLTSVDVNTATKRIAVAVQHADPMQGGKILLLDYDGNPVQAYDAGVQPDMVKFTADGRYVLTANEAEPRSGLEDPEGSVTILDTQEGSVVHVKFDDPAVIDETVHIRGAADPATGIITGSGSKADAIRDLEPEYIALSADESQAYVSLQENNAIAVINIAKKKVTAVHGLGYKNFNEARHALDLVKDGAIKLENAPFYGMYMPDGLAAHQIGGKTYLFTANEGDATEWPGKTNAIKLGKLKTSLNPDSEAALFLAGKTAYDNLEVVSDMDKDGVYLYGGRSFSIWHADTLEQVYDSGSDFERITGERLPDYFNASNSKTEMDDRSTKKGPEPEYIAVGEVGGRVLAFTGLERIGGVMTYDVTDLAQSRFVNYINTRDFQAGLHTDTGPEGLEFIPAADSPTGLPLLLVANEVGGTIAVLELKTPRINLDQTALSLRTGEAAVKLNASVLGGSDSGLVWQSSSPAVARVDQTGHVTPLSGGKAVITVRTADGYAEAQAVVTVAGPWKLTVMHTNDTHAHLADAARRATLVNQIREEGGRSLLVDAGDVFSGDLYFTKWMGLADLEFMNLMGYDAMTFGNHEFDQGTQTLADFIRGARFPLLSSNIDFQEDPAIRPLLRAPRVLDTLTAPSADHAGVYPYIVLDVNGQKVGVFGLTTEDTKETSSPGKLVAFRPANDAAAKTVQALQAEGIQVIIALSHLGYNRDRELAAAVPGIDVIVGGHTHTKLEAPVVLTSEGADPTVIVQANEWGKFLGRLDVTFDEQGVVMTGPEQLQGRLIPVDASVAEEPVAKSKLKPYNDELELLKRQKIGQAGVLLDGKREHVRSRETNLGNFIADGMLAKGKALKQANVALMNGGGIRDSIQQGDITMGALRTVMPFGNTLYVLEVTGQQLKAGLENGVSGAKLADLPGKFPQVAGMTFKWDPAQPAGQKVYDIRIQEGDGYAPLRPDGTYRIATNSFVASGGDGYASFAEAIAQGRYHEDLGYPDYENFIDHMNSLGGIIAPSVEGRIVEQAKPATNTDTDSDEEDTDTTSGNGSSSGSGTSGTGTGTGAGTGTPTSPEPKPNAEGSVHKAELPAGAAVITQQRDASGQMITSAVIGSEELKTALAQTAAGAGSGQQAELHVRVPTSGQAEVSLPAEALAAARGQADRTVIAIHTETASYQLPLHILKLDQPEWQGSLNQMSVHVSISPVRGEQLQQLEQAAGALHGDAALVNGTAIHFELTLREGGQSRSLNDFGQTYVTRSIRLPSLSGMSSATGVMYDPALGYQFVPGAAKTVDGRPVFELKRTGNSIYTVLNYKKSFADLQGHWSRSEVESLASKLIVQGANDTDYAPDRTITRAEFTALVVRSLGLAANGDASSFTDIPADSWFAGAVGAAVNLGLVEGQTPTLFAPDAQITRAEMAVLMMRAMQFADRTLSAPRTQAEAAFTDASSIPDWAQASAAWLADQAILQGDAAAKLAPAEPATRAEAAAVLLRALKKLGFVS